MIKKPVLKYNMTTIDVKSGDLELSIPFMEVTLPTTDDVTNHLTTKTVSKVPDDVLQNIVNKLVATSTVYMELIANNTPCGAEQYTITLLGEVATIYALLAHDNTKTEGDKIGPIDTKPVDVIIDCITGMRPEIGFDEEKPIESVKEYELIEEVKGGADDDELAKIASQAEKDLMEARSIMAKAAKEYAKKTLKKIENDDKRNVYRWVKALIASVSVVNFAIIIVVLLSIWTTNAGGSIVGGVAGTGAFITTVAKQSLNKGWNYISSYPTELYESIANTIWRDTESVLVSELEALEKATAEPPVVNPPTIVAENVYTDVSASSTNLLMNILNELFFKNVPFYVPLIGYVCLVSFLTIILQYALLYVEAKYINSEANAGTEFQKSINLVEERNTNTLQSQRTLALNNYNAQQLRGIGMGGGDQTTTTTTTTNNIFLTPPPEILRITNQSQLPPINTFLNQPRFGVFQPAFPMTTPTTIVKPTPTKPLAITNAPANVDELTNLMSGVNLGQTTQEVTVPVTTTQPSTLRRRTASVGPSKGGRTRKSTPHKVSNKRNRTYRN